MGVAELQTVYEKEKRRVFFLIDSKSFYASVECVQRGLNPLKAELVVLSEQRNTNGGLVLAASPMAKKHLGISNVTRKRELPETPSLTMVNPRMNLYIEKNMALNEIFLEFVDQDQILPYSIDESILDVTSFWHLFGRSPEEVAFKIQKEARERMGLYLTVGIGDSPVLAKLALDIEAKHAKDLKGTWHYEDVAERLWPITNLTEVWSIGKRTAKKLNGWGINSMADLASFDPYRLREKMGLMGEQLYALAWGIDRSELNEKLTVKNKSYSNSQVLPRDYRRQEEIEVVLSELADQVAARIRHHKKQARLVTLSIGYSYAAIEEEGTHGFHETVRIAPTNHSQILMRTVLGIFRKNWPGATIRNIYVAYGDLVDDNQEQLDLFSPVTAEAPNQVEQLLDQLRDCFGSTAIMRAISYEKGGTALERGNLVGGHNGGNSYE
ncbi:Y-family DNA polymerase [Fructobacillus fructosus]|uniref:Y-family DNA polymerase n=1 Tax=Fructobacillus fructosus TaxID=1631 RepID=UPI002D8C4110|nr:Nucleotidyltransferase/DNA polymerase DinP involved in DNA repair (DinP) [Fructobacillus fructosus]CAK1252503.1 Nucleotidyltransferase/DNA polymerase DinP involved in DNA repair (DinP) [Fructobacillus fructosus]CAK1252529.1 Nucleotidyltransferase/DNA polymerase DinP involved in DNA repair (DinP) [Fructobacillus fructosus]